MVFKSNNIHNFCPVVAQPGRASGCSCWLKMADRKNSISGIQKPGCRMFNSCPRDHKILKKISEDYSEAIILDITISLEILFSMAYDIEDKFLIS